MKTLKTLLTGLLFLALCRSAFAEEDGSRVWIERPWEFRYVVVIDSPANLDGWKRLGLKKLEAANPAGRQIVEAIFPVTTAIETDGEASNEDDRAVALLLIRFNEAGEVISPYNWPHKLFGYINRIRYVSLAPGNGPLDLQFDLGQWYTGRSSEETAYIPAICTHFDMERRYKKGYRADKYDSNGNVGCREWGYYLQSDRYPYIDVTSYHLKGDDYSKKADKRGKYQQTDEAYIRPVVGWGRFDIPPKPVIGKHGKVWVCLLECPNGETPGVIPDIKAWAARNGWPEPKPPKKQPMFPDRPFKPGEFVD